jgi:hypothetical protein
MLIVKSVDCSLFFSLKTVISLHRKKRDFPYVYKNVNYVLANLNYHFYYINSYKVISFES